MRKIESASDMLSIVEEYKTKGKTIGFTPTMGALHAGHHSLVKLSKSHNDITICSIFVNPTQFNNADDLTKYPRTVEADCQGLEEIGCDIVFLPTTEAIYPGGEENFGVELDLKGLDTLMEGEHRPGHFAGVVQVVKRLLDVIPASRLYMGQKDYQQFTIIRHMIKTLEIKTELVVCPIVREKHGLAMSSRNTRLTANHRERASIIYKTLIKAKESIRTSSIKSIQSEAMSAMNIPGFEPEYFTIINGYTLETIESISGVKEVVACTAVWAGEVRLIDNMRLIVEDETSTT